MIRSFLSTQNSPLVETKSGTLRGFLLDGIYTFHGIPYAYADRFQAPHAVEPWEGVRNATNYGYICPSAGSPAPSSELFIPHRFWPADEHCQFLNVWTPGLDDRKRPVMVWFHGGGYSDGSSIEQVAYEGDALDDTQALADLLKDQGMPAHLEIWGGDVSHDWYWWGKMWSLFAPRILEVK